MKVFCSLLISVLVLFSNTPAQSPYKISWEKDALILGTGTAVSVLGYSLEQKINPLSVQEISALSRNDVNAFDRSATYNWSKNLTTLSDVSVAITMLSPLTLFLDKNVQKDFQTISAMYFETLLFATFIPSIAKGTSIRVRPFVYNADAPQGIKLEAEAKKSFFSGHTTVAFASAVFLSSVYDGYFPDSKYKKYIWAGSLVTASVVGYLRYASGNHYPTDILTGAVVGSAIGYLIPYLHKTKGNLSDIFPTLNHANGLSIHYVVQF
ncbi:MAG: phosphatase PAP2 family protein [Ignavibacteriaceae bacterium]|jgi:membrane-associated phospholipid phosphatase